MTSVNGADHVARLLGEALRRVREEIVADSEQHFPGLRVSHYRLLELIPPEGARITDLAEVAMMTKQGLGQHVDYLQKLGYTESARLPEDRRVRLVRRTPAGDEAVAYGQAAIARVEHAWSTHLGPTRYAALRQTLQELGKRR
ncbi:DNA-binding MarR family transcriptional regulator [Kribbella aluminosa]|uniref:DNA-binding MarR family transcriptional regulator n=1 Tax=Kribbella aluminosa TaxID=416017 RepID=A0ABS4UF11_9ACTN|nr:MarR family winged helix-turn-helix transcriptional regulator [Kribbella aluminosa]MBP2350234.1 DNA-binding MarR family transcriptional regulator [Kribbella aluminosa]